MGLEISLSPRSATLVSIAAKANQLSLFRMSLHAMRLTYVWLT